MKFLLGCAKLRIKKIVVLLLLSFSLFFYPCGAFGEEISLDSVTESNFVDEEIVVPSETLEPFQPLIEEELLVEETVQEVASLMEENTLFIVPSDLFLDLPKVEDKIEEEIETVLPLEESAEIEFFNIEEKETLVVDEIWNGLNSIATVLVGKGRLLRTDSFGLTDIEFLKELKETLDLEESGEVPLLEKDDSVSLSFFSKTNCFLILNEVDISFESSLNSLFYVEVRFSLMQILLGNGEITEELIEFTVAGFDQDLEISFLNAVSHIKEQLIANILLLTERNRGKRSVLDIIDRDEIVVRYGKADGVVKGSTFSLVRYVDDKEGNRKAKTFGQAIAYKVDEEVTYCRILFLDDPVFVGDLVQLDSRIGLTTVIRTGFLGSLNKVTDFSGGSGSMTSGAIQSNLSTFSEYLAFVGIREIIDYGTSWIRPFFGLDFFLDGKKGSGDQSHSSEQLFALGQIEGVGFSYRESFTGLIRPYIGFQMELNLNRVTLAPQLAVGAIFNAPFSFSSVQGEAYTPPSGNSYESIPGSVFNYFTVEAGLDVEVRINSRFSFIFNAGYQSWIGNLIALKPLLSKKEGVDASLLHQEDFLKFFDWQFLTLGMGFSVSY